ncbi:TIGR00300 family protein [Conexivisphaera calida]|uniref:Uncharacterized protein n=1 Tax=Conexivisphaera calida TaxID=1874277 RepID=A0A4P2VNK0_9ARCH|nr:TIGR00300 family protein [Conexivisphaera calida]BBE42495.1 Uncharacterized protein NAS2_1106 [Conexivisphaera calida]
MYSQEVEVRGHLIDSMILSKIFDAIMDMGNEFEVLEFNVGKRKDEHSFVRLLVKADSRERLEQMLEVLYRLGAMPAGLKEASMVEAPADGVPPEGFYVATNNPTQIYVGGRWIDVRPVAANLAVVYTPNGEVAAGRPPWRIRKGELVVVGEDGVRVTPPERPREGIGIFEFMSSPAPRAVTPSLISGIAEEMEAIKEREGRIVVVAGSAVVRSGAADLLASLIRKGYVDSLISDGTLLTCDVELRLFGTCDGTAIVGGARNGYGNRVRAAVEIRRAGGIEGLVGRGVLSKGLAYEVVMRKVDSVQLMDISDEPVPGTFTDIGSAQGRILEVLEGADLVLALAGGHVASEVLKLLRSNMKLVVVDVSPEVALRVIGREIAQSVSVMSDVSSFLSALDGALEPLHA